jgi:PAS domain S-box-containing protein
VETRATQVDKIPIDKYRLRFPDELEKSFREDYFQKSLYQLRFGIILGTTIYALFGMLDAWITPEVKIQAWIVRFVVVIPACLAVLWFSYSAHFKKYMQITMFFLVLAAGGGIVALIAIVRSPVNYFHFAGLLLFIMYSYSLSKLRFVYMCIASWLIVGAYEIVALMFIHTHAQVVLTDNIFYIAANLFGMFSSYNREIYMRRDFFHNRMIQELEEKKHHREKEQLNEALGRTSISLQESEARFRTLAETTTAVIIIHRGGKFIYVNPAGEQMLSYSQDEFNGMDFWEIFHPECRDLVRERGQARLQGTPLPPEYEVEVIGKGGDVRWCNLTAGVIDYEGELAIIATLFDISARKHAEEERERLNQQLQQALQSLKESEAQFRTLAETTTAAIFIHQGERLLYANPAGVAMSGYSIEELLKRDFWTFVHPDYQDMVRERGQARVRGELVPPVYEFKFKKKNGDERWVTSTTGSIEYQRRPGIIATLFDITDWKNAEAAKTKFYEESVRQYQERIEIEKRHAREKEKILMDLHDGIGGITTNISILSELAQKAVDSENIKKTLGTIAQLSREGVSEIRSFMQSLDSRDLSWQALTAELRKQGTSMLEPHSIAFTIETSVEDAHEQPGSLLWVNLFKIYKETLTNVIKHSQATSVTVALKVSDQELVLVVQDNGIGWDGTGSGGRGLSNMQKRAKEVGGGVRVSAEEGARVCLEFPLPLHYPLSGMEL